MPKLFMSLFIFLCLISFNLNSQELGGKVTYKTKTMPPEQRYSDLKESDPEKYKLFLSVDYKIAEAMAQLEYTLNFNSKAAIYTAEPILGKGNDIAGGFQEDTGIYYNSIEEQERFHQTELQGKFFLVKRDALCWEITGETKKIGDYIAVRAVSSQNFYSHTSKKNIVQTMEAWFVPEIPVSFGPKGYGGLPGLIVDITVAGERLYATNIQLTSSKRKIEKPKKGKVVTFMQFLAISAGIRENWAQF